MKYKNLARTSLLLASGIFLSVSGVLVARVRAGAGQDPAPSKLTQKRLLGKVPKLAKSENFAAYMPVTDQIRMVLSFELRDQAGLDQLISQQYDPASPLYHQWLTPEQFGERFGRTPQEFIGAVNWLKEQGFDVDREYASRMSIGFTGTVDTVQRAFNVLLAEYWDEGNNRFFYSNMQPPTLPPAIDSIALDLTGLNDQVLFKHPARRGQFAEMSPEQLERRQRNLQDRGGYTPAGKIGSSLVLFPNDLALLYDYKPLWTNNIKGSGQKVGVIIDSDILDSDMNAYRSTTGLPATTVQRVLYSGFSNPGQTAGEIEADLDTQSISAAAPSAEIDLVLIPDLSFANIQTAEQDIIDQNTIKVVNESFGICESEGFSSTEQTIFNQAISQGIAFFASSGDEGAICDNQLFIKGTECPACYGGVTGVGGTSVSANFDSSGNVTSRASEVVWNTPPGVRDNCTGGSTGGGASGGGVCATVSMPSYQTSSQGFSGGVPSGTKRYVPDVAAIADPGNGSSPIGALLVYHGLLYYGGGTSQSSPLMAGMMALINQFKGSAQGSPNTVFYQLGVNQYKNGGPHAFLDITSGNNNVTAVSPCFAGTTGFSAGTGYDAVAGWGVPDLSVIANNFGGSSQFGGSFDGAGCNTIEGWAWDANNPNTTVSVDIYDGATLVGTATAGMYREDLLNVLGSPNHGFSFTTPSSLKDGAVHSVTVKIHGTSTSLPGGPRSVHCTGAGNFQGALDGVGCDAISGWAWDSTEPGGVVNVDLYDGSTLIGSVTATLYRQDLQNVFGSPYHGFTFPAPASLKDGATHTITAKYGGTITTLTWNNPQSFSCTSLSPNCQGSQDPANCTSISGYAWDTNNDRCTIDVAIYKDGAFQVVIPAQQALAGIGNGYHGFIFAIPASWKDGKSHSILVRFSGTSTALSNSPRSLTCP